MVSISSVGAGALGTTVLVLLYPRLPMASIVGSDIGHAVPLTLLAGVGHWLIGSINPSVILMLLAGSLPGIVAGSTLAIHAPDPIIRLVLAGVLFIVGSRLIF
jgi:uncharacterized protein